MATQLVCDRCDQPIRGAKAGNGLLQLRYDNGDVMAEHDLCGPCLIAAEQFVTGEQEERAAHVREIRDEWDFA